MPIQWTAIADFCALIAAATAVLALVVGERRSRLALQTDLLLKYYDKFYSPEMHRLRTVAAEKLLRGESPNYELEDVLDYFGIIAALLERKALDHRLTHGLFDWWILRYWQCAHKYVQWRRADPDDPNSEMWTYLERMVNDLAAYCRTIGSPVISEGALRRFLQEESRSIPKGESQQPAPGAMLPIQLAG
jgi:hypothetical protein